MEERIERLVKWARGEKASPYTLELNLTKKCNLRCRMCWLRGNQSNGEEMGDEDVKRVIREALDLGVREVRIPGSGEPFMRKKLLLEVMEMVKERKAKGLVITNGTLIEDEDARRIVEMGWDILTISIDGPREEVHDSIRGVRGAFRRTMEAIKRINEWKKKMGKEKPVLRMNVILAKDNLSMLKDMLKLGKRLGFSEVLFQPITIFSDEGRKMHVEGEILEKVLKEVEIEARKLGVETNVQRLIEERGFDYSEIRRLIFESLKGKEGFLKTLCFEPWYNMVISPEGFAGPCAVFGRSEINVRDHSLREIWFNLFEEYREKLKNGKFLEFCKNCCVPIFLENQRIRRELEARLNV